MPLTHIESEGTCQNWCASKLPCFKFAESLIRACCFLPFLPDGILFTLGQHIRLSHVYISDG